MSQMHGRVLTAVLVLIASLGVAAFLTWSVYCPCERTPGGYLLGNEAAGPVLDWSFINDLEAVPLCQIQVQAGVLPHSVNLNCMADQGELFLSCANCDGKRWSQAALDHPDARLRAGSTVYAVRISRVTDTQTLDRAWMARAAKLGRPSDTPRQDGWWSFRVVSR